MPRARESSSRVESTRRNLSRDYRPVVFRCLGRARFSGDDARRSRHPVRRAHRRSPHRRPSDAGGGRRPPPPGTTACPPHSPACGPRSARPGSRSRCPPPSPPGAPARPHRPARRLPAAPAAPGSTRRCSWSSAAPPARASPRWSTAWSRRRVSAAGVLRPTTRSPVLVCNPADAAWFRQGELLPGLTRTTEPSEDPRTLQLVTAPALPAGLAFLDAPDIDSVVDANRALAGQLLAAADLWLFVTTAARYADAVPWELLRTARARGAVIAMVLDRVPAEAADEIAAHLTEMLAAQDLGAAPLFVLPETWVDGQGLLPERVTAPLRRLVRPAGRRRRRPRRRGPADPRRRARRAAPGGGRARRRRRRAGRRRRRARRAGPGRLPGRATGPSSRGCRTAGCSAARCSPAGRSSSAPASSSAPWRPGSAGCATGSSPRSPAGPRPPPSCATPSSRSWSPCCAGSPPRRPRTRTPAWKAHPAGAALLDPALAHPAATCPSGPSGWSATGSAGCWSWSATEGGDKRFVARTAAYAVNATGLAVMIAVFASTAFIPTGLEVATGAGTTVAAQKVLQAIFGDQAVRTLAAKARADLLDRVGALLDDGGRPLPGPAPRAARPGADAGDGAAPGRRPGRGGPAPQRPRRRGRAGLPGDRRGGSGDQHRRPDARGAPR